MIDRCQVRGKYADESCRYGCGTAAARRHGGTAARWHGGGAAARRQNGTPVVRTTK